LILIKNASYIVQDADRVLEDQDLLINGRRIERIGRIDPEDEGIPRENVLAGHGYAVLPGFVNAHTHLYQNLLKGCRDDLPLEGWMNQVTFPLCKVIYEDWWDHQNGEGAYYASLLGCLEMIKSGTTCFFDMELRVPTVCDAIVDSGIRGIYAPTLADQYTPPSMRKPPDEMKQEIEQFIEKYHRKHERIRVGLAPSTPYICSKELLLWAMATAQKNDMPLQIHVAENKWEVERTIEERGLSPVRYLRSIGFLSGGVLLGHCIHLDDKEIAILKDTDSVVVHMPKSNMKLASGIARIAEMTKQGVRVALGNDGSASNDIQDMFEEMRACAFLQRALSGDAKALTARQVFDMATKSGARACRSDSGVLEPGRLADIIMVNLMKAHLLPIHDVISNIVYCGKAEDVDNTIVDGKIVMRGRKIIGLDEQKTLLEASRVAEGYLERIKESS